MTDDRPCLVAMNNPLSTDPKYDLYPLPHGCAGNRLYEMLREAAERADVPRVSYSGYVQRFDRRNVLRARTWSVAEAREAGAAILPALAGRRVLVLGVQTLSALGLERTDDWCQWRRGHAARAGLFGDDPPPHETVYFDYAVVPHPSGRCREYNEARTREAVGALLLRMYGGAPC